MAMLTLAHLAFIRPFQPILSAKVATGSEWLHEVKYDAYRLIARKDGSRVRLWSRNGRNWTDRFQAIAAVERLPDVARRGVAVRARYLRPSPITRWERESAPHAAHPSLEVNGFRSVRAQCSLRNRQRPGRYVEAIDDRCRDEARAA